MRYYRFSTYGLIRVTGKDSQRYLNARLTCNVKDLNRDKVIKGSQLTAQGKCQGIFSVIRSNEAVFMLVSAFAPTENVLPPLRQFIVADRVDTIDASSEYAFFHVFKNDTLLNYLEAQQLHPECVIQDKGLIAWNEKRGIHEGIDILVPVMQLAGFESFLHENNAQILSDDEMLIQRAMVHKPEYPLEIDQTNIFSESSLPEYISFSKGCYVGQEVIERIDAMGKTAWKIVSYRSPVKLGPKTLIQDQLGSIINCSDGTVEGVHWGFARIRNNTQQANQTMRIAESEIVIDV